MDLQDFQDVAVEDLQDGRCTQETNRGAIWAWLVLVASVRSPLLRLLRSRYKVTFLPLTPGSWRPKDMKFRCFAAFAAVADDVRCANRCSR